MIFGVANVLAADEIRAVSARVLRPDGNNIFERHTGKSGKIILPTIIIIMTVVQVIAVEEVIAAEEERSVIFVLSN